MKRRRADSRLRSSPRVRLVVTSLLAMVLLINMTSGTAAANDERRTPHGTLSTGGFTCVIHGCFLFMDSPATQAVARELETQADITSAFVKALRGFGAKAGTTGPLSWANGVKAKVARSLRQRDHGCGVILYAYWNPFDPFWVDSQRC